MKTIIHATRQLLLLTSMGFFASPFLTAEIVTNYQSPEKFTDFKVTSITKKSTQRIFDREIKRNRVLQLIGGEGRTLELNFTDIDMAGYIDPFVGRFPSNSIRIIKSTFPPRLEFTYALKNAEGTSIAMGEVNLSDIGLSTKNSLRGYRQTNSFSFELELIENWAIKTFSGNEETEEQS
ncbi:MAG: DUF3016 domain-containing protein [Verrucomicrobiota bacterium]